MQTLRAIALYSFQGIPVWAWFVFLFLIPTINEAINRSKWTKAQSLWQFFWRLVAATPLGAIPYVGKAIQIMAIPKEMREQTASGDIFKGVSILILFFIPALIACNGTLESKLYKGAYTLAVTSMSCFQTLDKVHDAKIAYFKANVGAPGIQALVDGWKKQEAIIESTCKAGRFGAETAEAAIPSILAAADKTQATNWLANLTKLGTDIASALQSVNFGGP